MLIPLGLVTLEWPGVGLEPGVRFSVVAWMACLVAAWPKRSQATDWTASSVWWWSALAPWIWVVWHLEAPRTDTLDGRVLVFALCTLALAVLCGAPVPSPRRGWQAAWFGLLWWAPLFLAVFAQGSREGLSFQKGLWAWVPGGALWEALHGEPGSMRDYAWSLACLAVWGLGVHAGFRRRP